MAQFETENKANNKLLFRNFKRELSIMSTLKHQNVIEAKEHCKSKIAG
jgi:L-cysteine desulfidase